MGHPMTPMHLPNYFIADLPPEVGLRPAMVTEACQTLKRNRERYLLPRSTESIVQVVMEVARQWLAPHSPWRTLALEQGPAATGFSREMLSSGLETFFRQLTPRHLSALVVQDLGHPQRLDRLVANDAETFMNTLAHVRGPELLVHYAAGMLPTPVFTALVHGLLVRSAQFVKCATGATLLPRLFAHSLRDVEPKLASCLELGAWKGGTRELESALFGEAECVVASGSDEAIDGLRQAVPSRVRFLGHGHRVSAGYVAREVLGDYDEARVVAAAAADVAAWDQLGCLSPQVIFVEMGGNLPPEGFAKRLAEELAKVEARLPRGPVDASTAAAIYQRREFYRVRAAASDTTRCWFSPESTAWSVVYESDPQFHTTCAHRFVLVKAVDTLEECLRQAEPFRGRWSTVGLAASGVRAEELAQQFASWGITRICPLGRMQQPPLTWRHDGRPVLGDLVTWTNFERLE
jgi:hypothetical protein